MPQFTPEQVFADYISDMGGPLQRTRSPWKYDKVPDAIAKSPVEIRIFNIGPHEHTAYMGSLGNKRIQACPDDQPYVLCQEIHQYTIDWADMGEYNHKPLLIPAEELAVNMISPDSENDLRRWGVFATRNEVPTEKEIKAAKELLFQTYDWLVKKADRLYQTRKEHEITDIYRIAATKLRLERDWCRTLREPAECPACHKPCEHGIVKHQECGAILDWKKALSFGMVTKDQYDFAVEEGLAPAEKPKEHKVVPVAK